MHESDLPTPNDDAAEGEEAPAADIELDAIADDLDTVEAAMKALDADDLDGAESLAASLGASSDDGSSDDGAGADGGSVPADDSGPSEG